MTENWMVYMARVNDEVASVSVDLALWDLAPNPQLPVIAWVFVEMKQPRPDGLPSREEAPALGAIEDRLTEALKPSGTVLAGIIGSAGFREFYFYAPDEAEFRKTAEATIAVSPEYRFEVGAQPDLEWSQYLNVLYPSKSQMRMSQNVMVLEQLKSRGDIPTEKRPIDHFVYFPAPEARDMFRKWAAGQGFAVSPSKTDTDEQFGLQLTREDTADPDKIHEVTFQLLAQAEEFEGEYDGWGCPVVSRDKQPKRSWLDKVFKSK